MAVKSKLTAGPNATADAVETAVAKQSRTGLRWPLQGSQQGAGAAGSAADGSPQGGVPCADGCERHGNCNRDSGRCE